MKKKTTIRRNTYQREVIYQMLGSVSSHPTAKELHQMIKKKNLTISLGTVYRNLAILECEGKVLKLKTKGQDARYDGCADAHCHLFCEKCGKLEEIFDITKVVIKSKSLKKLRFQINYDLLELQGRCNQCK